MRETRDLLGKKGIKYTITVGLVLRRLPTENFLALQRLLFAIAQRRGAFTLTGLPVRLTEIVGIPEQRIPGIDWDKFNLEAEPHGCPGDILGTFIHTYFEANNTLDLSNVGRFEESRKKRADVQTTLDLG